MQVKTCWLPSLGAPLDGGRLAFNVAIMLISFLALIAMVNGFFGYVHSRAGWFPHSLDAIIGALFAPIAWLIGIPWHSARLVGNLLGTRMVINELVAYSLLGAQKSALDPRSFTIATFALCGFANLSSIGIQIGGIGGARHPLAGMSSPNWGFAQCLPVLWPT